MVRSERAWTLLEVAAVVLLVAMLAGQVLGQPILLSYVETGSMSPTLEPGDGFVAVPAQLAGPVEEGDVVVFEAEELHGGGLTTHRVVGETDRGYVTRGDANPFTDQDGDEPPVQEAQIVAVAWQPGGDVLIVPGVGTVVTGTQSALEAVQVRLAGLFGMRSMLGAQGLGYLLFGVTVVVYAVSAWLDDGTNHERSRKRDTGTNVRVLLGGLALLVAVAATAAMVAPAGAQQFDVVSAESDSPSLRVIEQGTSESVDYPVGNGGLVPVVAYLEPESDGVSVDQSRLTVPERTTVNATLTLTAPPETGHYRYFLTEYRYLAVLPAAHIDALYEVHPWLPVAVVDALLAVPFYLLSVRLVGTGRLRSRSRDGPSRLELMISRLRSRD